MKQFIEDKLATYQNIPEVSKQIADGIKHALHEKFTFERYKFIVHVLIG